MSQVRARKIDCGSHQARWNDRGVRTVQESTRPCAVYAYGTAENSADSQTAVADDQEVRRMPWASELEQSEAMPRLSRGLHEEVAPSTPRA